MSEQKKPLSESEARREVEEFDKMAGKHGLPLMNEYSRLEDVQTAEDLLEGAEGTNVPQQEETVEGLNDQIQVLARQIKSDGDSKQLVPQIQALEKRRQTLREPKLQKPAVDWKFAQSLVDRIGDAKESESFKTLIAKFPVELQLSYVKRLAGSFKKDDEVSVRMEIRGLLFEMSRIGDALERGRETIDFNIKLPERVRYEGFPKGDVDFSGAPDRPLEHAIELDVPTSREGKPFIHEVKWYSRRFYGQSAKIGRASCRERGEIS